MANKIFLPNGCSMSTPSVNPTNWKTGGASLLKNAWRIQYYFYPEDGSKAKLIVVKGMNEYNYLVDRRRATKAIIEADIEALKMGYNPISRKYNNNLNENSELHPYLDFISAFRIAIAKIKSTEKHRKEMVICVNRLEKKVIKLRLQNVVIEQLTRRQLKQLIEACNLPNSYYNKYLSYLSRIFGELVEYECCELNIVRDIRKRVIITKQREILSSEDYKIVMDYLSNNHYEFWRYARIFLFSGARSTELLRLQAKDVDILNQEYKITILKGNRPKETVKVILSEVIPLWQELIENAKPNDFLFGRGLNNGSEPILPSQITKRWSRLVKKSDKIKDTDGRVIKVTADFYSLKHSFLDSLPEEKAMLLASHTNSKTTSIYRVNKEKNEREELKKMKIENTSFN